MSPTALRLGRGLSFPLVPTEDGRVEAADGPAKVRQAILLVLQTEPGERVMRPQFGAGLRRYVMEPNTPATRALVKRDVTTALERWEPRVTVDEVAVTSGADPATVDITVRYTIKRTGRSDLAVHALALE